MAAAIVGERRRLPSAVLGPRSEVHDSTVRSKRDRAASPKALGHRARPVWVDLRLVFPAGEASEVPDGLCVDEVVGGGLWGWVRTSTGAWLGVVTFHLTYQDGGAERYVADRQLVPAHALRPR